MAFFGVPGALLSDRGTDLSPNLMQDISRLLGTQKLNTMAYHPQCDEAAERLIRHIAEFGNQWNQYLPLTPVIIL